MDKGTRISGSAHQSRGFSEPLDASAWTIPHGRTTDWSMPFTLGAPLGPAADIPIPEPGQRLDEAALDGEVAATLAPPPAARLVADDFAIPAYAPELPPPRTPVVPAARRMRPAPPLVARRRAITFDYPLSEPALWPDAFNPDYGRPFRPERAQTARPAARGADAPAVDPGWVQHHRIALVVAFGIIPFVAVPLIALLGTRSARLVLDLQVPQMSYFLDWVIVGAVTIVAGTLVAIRYGFRRRRAREPVSAVGFETVGQET